MDNINNQQLLHGIKNKHNLYTNILPRYEPSSVVLQRNFDLDVGDNHLYNKTADKSVTEYHTYEGQKTSTNKHNG